jgi:TetR/AcrR family transcriptional regulator, transcriptional repressor of bet genes
LPKTARKLRSEERIAERRRSITQAAITVIAREGLPGVILADVAREAGCSYGVVSFHFKSKDRLLLAALDALMLEYREAWLACSDAHADTISKLVALIDLDFASPITDARFIAVSTAFWAEAARNAEYRKRLKTLTRAYLDRLELLIKELADQEPPILDYRHIALGISTLVDGLWLNIQVDDVGRDSSRTIGRQICRSYLEAYFPRTFQQRRKAPAKPPKNRRLVPLKSSE